MTIDFELYRGREQTLVKHSILQRYLSRFAHIIGTFADTITYVDCFSGPWNVASNEFEDSSFAIAINELRKARHTLAGKNRHVNLRCFFIEKDPTAYAKLHSFVSRIADIEIAAVNGTFEHTIPDILKFCSAGGRTSFPFFFVDPCGCLEIETIEPLLRVCPGEVLINFMTSFVRRFFNSEEKLQHLCSSDSLPSVDPFSVYLPGDEQVFTYASEVRKRGNFQFACTALVLNPERSETHYHLIYGTRHPKGVEVFKDVERAAMRDMERARAEAEFRKKAATGQLPLYSDPSVTHDVRIYNQLRSRYPYAAQHAVWTKLQQHGQVDYDDAWAIAMQYPLTWESDLLSWIECWQSEGDLSVTGLKDGDRLKHRKGGVLCWVGKRLY
jgi:three-Cys-motif partner protein